MSAILEAIDKTRIEVNPFLKNKSELGQFFTPSSVAKFMSTLFTGSKLNDPILLDAGAGIGSLTSAFLERLVIEQTSKKVTVNVAEVDEILLPFLSSTIELFQSKLNIETEIITSDFISWAVETLSGEESLLKTPKKRYTHAILNPPYKKINSNSKHRKLLRSVGIETVNLYSAFLGLVIELMAEKGEIVAIIPRSFCNGPYYKPFRQQLLDKTAIKHIHLFDSRDKAFKDDDVLQENVIIKLERGVKQEDVKISTSNDATFVDYAEYSYSFDKIVQPNDIEQFIHIPTSQEESFLDRYPSVCYTIKDIGVEVSTGPVVDFRMKEHLRETLVEGTVPLLYPQHFVNTKLEYPRVMKKPNAIVRDELSEKWLFPNGYYTVVKRFSSKEEKRRVVAGVINPIDLDFPVIGFENHFNVFHSKKQGIEPELAYGLYAYLNSTAVDKYFRVFNGHTQVNATDLKTMKYPNKEKLQEFGRWVISNYERISQEDIDNKLEEIL